MEALRLVAVGFVVATSGCGGADTPLGSQEVVDAATDSPSTSDLAPEPISYEPCAAAARVGGFQLLLAATYTGVNGQVLDGVVPANLPEVAATEGPCALLKARSLFCDPPCAGGETCGEQACIAYPESHSVGSVVVSGLQVDLTMESKWGDHYTNPDPLPHPGFVPGAVITFAAAGGDYQPFSLRAVGIAPLDVPSPRGRVLIAEGEATDLAWTPGPAEEAVKLRVEVNINNHGASSAWISCDVEDTGDFSLPASLMTRLFALGVSGFPTVTLSRRSAGAAEISPGCVDLVVSSDVDLVVEVEGVTSCTSDAQCPAGQTCGLTLSCG